MELKKHSPHQLRMCRFANSDESFFIGKESLDGFCLRLYNLSGDNVGDMGNLAGLLGPTPGSALLMQAACS